MNKLSELNSAIASITEQDVISDSEVLRKLRDADVKHLESVEVMHLFEAYVDEMEGPVRIFGLAYSAGEILKELDKHAYRTEFGKWIEDNYVEVADDNNEIESFFVTKEDYERVIGDTNE